MGYLLTVVVLIAVLGCTAVGVVKLLYLTGKCCAVRDTKAKKQNRQSRQHQELRETLPCRAVRV